ncbi:MAG: hypothetical protein IPG64_11005 [Haliea sp.]|nr:hypothetical protein [Haliea sp.]
MKTTAAFAPGRPDYAHRWRRDHCCCTREEIAVRARGALLPLLAPDVYTLAEHGADNPR